MNSDNNGGFGTPAWQDPASQSFPTSCDGSSGGFPAPPWQDSGSQPFGTSCGGNTSNPGGFSPRDYMQQIHDAYQRTHGLAPPPGHLPNTIGGV